MNKLIIFTTLFVLFLVFVVPGSLLFLIDEIPSGDQPGYSANNKLIIQGSRVVMQEFEATDSNLSAIATTIGNPNLKNKKEIIFDLYDTEEDVVREENAIREVKISGLNLPDGNFFRFNFAPIADSKGKHYIFEISTPDAAADEVLYIYHTKDVPGWIGRLDYQGEYFEDGVIPFVAYYLPKSKIELIGKFYTGIFKRVVGISG